MNKHHKVSFDITSQFTFDRIMSFSKFSGKRTICDAYHKEHNLINLHFWTYLANHAKDTIKDTMELDITQRTTHMLSHHCPLSTTNNIQIKYNNVHEK